MIYTVSLYTSLTIFAIGCAYKFLRWFSIKIGPEARDITFGERIAAGVGGIFGAIFSRKIAILWKVFFIDVLLQGWLIRKGYLRWLAHLCVYGGFVFLLVMHGLEHWVTARIFPDYASTLNPYMFLRDLAAGIVLLGIVLVLIRRFFSKRPRPRTTAPDWFAIAVIVVIMVTGVLLEGMKIPSYSSFVDMAEEYGGLDSQEKTGEFRALEAYWVDSYGTVSPEVKGPFDAALLEQGEELHGISCIDCHSRPYWAFIGYGVAGAIRPFVNTLDRTGLKTVLGTIHYLACFLGLAWLPFSKLFHIIATPLYLLVNAVWEEKTAQPANIATKRAMELDGCTHCGECTTRCSVAVMFGKIPNPNILPSEKLIAVKVMASGKKITPQNLMKIQEGNHICTDCHRCTDVCPVGIDLEAQWRNLGYALTESGFPRLDLWAREGIRKLVDVKAVEGRDLVLPCSDEDMAARGLEASLDERFSVCYGCQTCTNVCPVVSHFADPKEQVDLFPHQIMHALALGRRDLALGSRMLWDCVTCYMCQEECPQGVEVTEILYDLKNSAVKQVKDSENRADWA